jgi:hypothetical protein
MADSYVVYPAPAGQQFFTVPFPFLNKAHVFLSINGVEQLVPADYDWQNDGSIALFGTLINNSTVRIWRMTAPDGALVQFQNGAVLTADQLNTAALQALYRTQELQDALDTYINGGVAQYEINGNNAGLTPAELIAQAAASVLSSALASDLLSRINDIDMNAQSILDQNTRLVDLRATLDALAAPNGGIASLVQQETDARVTGDIALADIIALLGAKNGANDAFILNTSTVLVDSTTSLATTLAGLISESGANSAAISAEASTRATADTAEANARTTLSTTVSGNTSTIATQATSIGGLNAQYTVKVDVNGHVAGFGLASTPINGVPTSDFTVVANRFSIIDPGNGLAAPTVPFTVSGGVVFMSNVVIQNANIQNMTITKLTQGSLNADMNIGTGRIIWDNGAFMKVAGVGFGSANQFIEWFGPHMAITSCNEANAIYYLKTTGSAYFGGTLLAGKLANSTQATLLTSANLATLGPFASNGGQITVTTSYVFSASNIFAAGSAGEAAWDGQAKGDASITLVLSRSVNGGAFTDVATYGVSAPGGGTRPTNIDSGVYGQSGSGSWTFTDNAGSALPHTFKVRISVFSNVLSTVNTNTIAVQTVE